jgi:hypothetical protein
VILVAVILVGAFASYALFRVTRNGETTKQQEARTMIPALHAVVPSQNFSMSVTQGETRLFRLETNPTTGLTWWVEDAPNNVVVKEVGTEAGTITCPIEMVGCGQVFQVFSVTSSIVGEYVVEFRLGRRGAPTEYYRVAYLKLSVQAAQPGETIGSPFNAIARTFWRFLEWIRCLLWNCNKPTSLQRGFPQERGVRKQINSP